jgi:hypothetical protein
MSTQQPNSACLVSVDPSTADILRRQTLIILEVNHYYFEEILEFGPEAQHALSFIYRDAFAVLDAIGWRRTDDPPVVIDVPLTAGHVEQLRRCRLDLGHTNINRLDQLDAAATGREAARIRSHIDADRDAAQQLDRLFGAFDAAVRGTDLKVCPAVFPSSAQRE